MPSEGERTSEPRQPAPAPKDFWDKISTLTIPFVTLVVGLLGAYATYSYNQASLEQQRAQAISDSKQRAQQAADAKVIADAEQLQKLFVYLSSPDPQQREFGYWMFDALGKRELAIRLIDLKRDKAGLELLLRSRSDPKPAVRAAASQALASLLTTQQKTAIGSVIDRFEGVAPATTVRRIGRDVQFGTNGWQAQGGGLQALIDRYCGDPAAKERALCDPANHIAVPITDRQFALLQSAASDPVMQQIELSEAKAGLDATTGSAEAIARATGVKLPLSVAILTDTIHWMGSGAAKALAAKAAAAVREAAGGSLDEKAWARAFLSQRRQRVGVIAARLGPAMLPAMQRRNDYYEQLVDAGKWDMAGIDAAAVSPNPK